MDEHAGRAFPTTGEDVGVVDEYIFLHPHSAQTQDQNRWVFQEAKKIKEEDISIQSQIKFMIITLKITKNHHN